MSRHPSATNIGLPPVDPQAMRAAALTICDHATGLDDARTLLQMAGLAPYIGHVGARARRKPIVRGERTPSC